MNMRPIKPVSAPHTVSGRGVGSIMSRVMLALTPATLFGIYLFGWPALNLFVLCLVSAVAFEALCLRLAGKKIRPFLMDGSALLSGWLLAMTLPPQAPWWIAVCGAAIAIVLGKQVYGGLGQNLFNPAMLARVALLISFPVEMTTWANTAPLFSAADPGFAEGLKITFKGLVDIDATTGATVLGHVKTELSQSHFLPQSMEGVYDPWASVLGNRRGSLGETSALLLVAGGGWLLFKRIVSWHIPVSLLATVALLAAVFHAADPQRYLAPLAHLTSGALMCTAFFIATDYVTSPNSRAGQILFGIGCGALIFVIRTFGGYPEGAGFAILLMNAMTPLIDHYIRPRIVGRTRRGKPLELPEP